MSKLPSGNPRIPEGINSQEENPLKEFAQLFLGVFAGLALLAITLIIGIQLLAPYVPFDWEKRAIPLVEEYLAAEGDSESIDPKAQEALKLLGQRLLASAEKISLPSAGIDEDIHTSDYSFHLIHSEVPNAYASFGGQVFVTDTLISQVSSENALAMVVAHEIAHVQYRHPIQASSRAVVLQLVLYALLGSSADGALGSVLSSSSLLALLSFNRDMELQSDKRALDMLYGHYGTYLGADEFFKEMALESNNSIWLEFTQTHPHTDRRLEQIHSRIEGSEKTAGVLTPLSEHLQKVRQDSEGG